MDVEGDHWAVAYHKQVCIRIRDRNLPSDFFQSDAESIPQASAAVREEIGKLPLFVRAVDEYVLAPSSEPRPKPVAYFC